MSIWVVGDVHGCIASLDALVNKIDFQLGRDEIWFIGDLVNRGPDSLGVINRVRNELGGNLVLGNHDLHLMALYTEQLPINKKHNLSSIIDDPQVDDIITWLRHCPLIKYFPQKNTLLVHAGLAPIWTLEQALALGKEAQGCLQSDDWAKHLFKMYGNLPNIWSDQLKGYDRWRTIINYLTRLRCCDLQGKMDFSYTGSWEQMPAERVPWFVMPHRRPPEVQVVFGHWSALQGDIGKARGVKAIDEGCVWGGQLAAYNLDTGVVVRQPVVDKAGHYRI